jgi:CheY-like chemotaxis protein
MELCPTLNTRTRNAKRPPRKPGTMAPRNTAVQKPYVLLIDDDQDGREIFQDVLNAEGYRVESAAGGAAALKVLLTARGRPFLVLVDLLMPQMNGWEFCERATAVPTLKGVPIWVMSAAVLKKPLPPGIRNSLLKPVDIDVLFRVVRDAWDARR